MTKRILIDGVHLDEVRVAVVNDDRLEEFDFENVGKKQIKGNIYLGKITRVEPSLQAAFVEYGGNRQGFLPFSEVHYGYFNIPVSDKEAIGRAQHEGVEDGDDEDVAPIIDATATVMDEAEDDTQTDQAKNDNATAEDDKDEQDNPDVIAADAEDESAVETTIELPDDLQDASQVEAGEQAESDDTPKRTRKTKTETKDENAQTVESSADETQDKDAETKPKRTRRKAAAKPKTEEVKEADSPKEPVSDVDEEARKKAEELASQYSEDDWVNDTPEESSGKSGEKKRPARKKSSRRTKKTDDAEQSTDVNDEDSSQEVVISKSRHFGPEDRFKAKESVSVEGDDTTVDTEDEAEEFGGDDVEVENISRGNYHKQYKIQEVLKRGQIVLIQVIKEERGNKGASLTTHISLAGRYCVLMPNADRSGGVSRRIDDHKDRQRLKAMVRSFDVPQGMSVIVRTAGIDQEEGEIKRDYDRLKAVWGDITTATMDAEAPALIHEEGSLIKCTLRDMYRSDVDQIVVQGEDAYKSAENFMKKMAPQDQEKLVAYSDREGIFHAYGIDKQLDDLYSNEAMLPSGGSIVIAPTEALVSIDVNSGKATRERSIEDTALSTNLEAANEVARQLRLRDLAGLVVIDFIDMREIKNRRAVEKELKAALKRDRAKIQVGRISTFGLMEMSRQRMRSSIVESSFTTCPHCKGVGVVRSNESVAVTILRAIEHECQQRNQASELRIRVSRQALEYVLNAKRSELMQIEQEHDIYIELSIDENMFGAEYQFEKRRGGRNKRAKNDNQSQKKNNSERDRNRKQGDKPKESGKNDNRQDGQQGKKSRHSKHDESGNSRSDKRSDKKSSQSTRRNSKQKNQNADGNQQANNTKNDASNKGNVKVPSSMEETLAVVDDSIGNRIDDSDRSKKRGGQKKSDAADKSSNKSGGKSSGGGQKDTKSSPKAPKSSDAAKAAAAEDMTLEGERSRIMDIWKRMTR